MVFGNYGDTLGKTYKDDLDARRRLINKNRFKKEAEVDAPNGISFTVEFDATDAIAHAQVLTLDWLFLLRSAAELLAQGLASANSPWPFVTGESRQGFHAGTQEPDSVSVDNNVSYAPYVEEHYDGVAHKYVERHLDEAIATAADEYYP